ERSHDNEIKTVRSIPVERMTSPQRKQGRIATLARAAGWWKGPLMQRRDFLTASAAVIAGAGAATAGQQDDVSRLGRTAHTKFAPTLEMWWPGLPFLDRIREAARLGYTGIEFWPYEGKDINAVGDLCQKLQIEVVQFTAWGFRPGLNDPKNHDRFVNKLEEACKVAQRLNCRMMCVVGGDDVPGMSQQQMHENIITGLRRGAPVAEKHNITLILEPMNIRVDHKGHCLYGSDPTIRILRAVNSRNIKML